MTSPANATPESRTQSSTDTELKEPGRFHVIFYAKHRSTCYVNKK